MKGFFPNILLSLALVVSGCDLPGSSGSSATFGKSVSTGSASTATSSATNPTAPPTSNNSPSGLTITGLAVDSSSACAIVNSQADCWGYTASNNDAITVTSIPTIVLGLSGVQQIASSGDESVCALSGGAVSCWGVNTDGELGNGTNAFSSIPVPVTGLSSGVTQIAAANGSTCAVVSGAAKCWGYNQDNELGNGSTTDSNIPVQVLDMTSGVTAVSVADTNVGGCAIKSGAVYCWSSAHNPTVISGFDEAVSVSGSYDFGCAIISTGAVLCWGEDQYGQLGNNSNVASAGTAVPVAGLTSGATSISVDYDHACAVVDGTGYCWGANAYGEFGNGTTTSSLTPTAVKLSGITSISTASESTCATTSANRVYCWGNDPLNFEGTNSNDGNLSNADELWPSEVTSL